MKYRVKSAGKESARRLFLKLKNDLQSRRIPAFAVASAILAAALLIFGAAAILLHKAGVEAAGVRPSAVEGHVSKSVSECVCRLLAERADCKEIVYGQNGEIARIALDERAVNALSADVVGTVTDRLSEPFSIGIPIGTLTGAGIFSGRGFPVGVRCTLYPSVRAEVVSDLYSAGINQTVHRAILRVTVNLTSVSFGESENASFSYDFLIGETLIVGSVPLSA